MSRLVPYQDGINFAPSVPIPLFIMDSKIPRTAMVVYGYMLSRSIGSGKNESNRFTDEKGVFIYASIDEIAATLHRGKTSIQAAVTILEDKGFIKKERRGCNKSNKYYVMVLDNRKSGVPDSQKTAVPED